MAPLAESRELGDRPRAVWAQYTTVSEKFKCGLKKRFYAHLVLTQALGHGILHTVRHAVFRERPASTALSPNHTTTLLRKAAPMTRYSMIALLIGSMALFTAALAEKPQSIPDPDGKPADMTKPVRVFILMGQSNMVGAGKVNGGDGSLTHAVKEKDLYPYLIDDSGAWTTRKDVRNVFVMDRRGRMGTRNNEWLTIKGGKIGPEIGIGHQLGEAIDGPVLILKSCIGNRCLGWDLLPPGSERYEHGGKIHAGYKDSYSIVKGPWAKGQAPAKPDGGKWYAGWQYDIDVKNAKSVLANLEKYYPGAKEYEVAGFCWWQGAKDLGRAEWYDRYETNLQTLIKALRKDFDAPDAKFVCATLGQTDKDKAAGAQKALLEAMFAISNPNKHPEFKGDTATVYAHPLSQGGSANSHYGGNAETYMNVGEAMGKAMVELLKEAD